MAEIGEPTAKPPENIDWNDSLRAPYLPTQEQPAEVETESGIIHRPSPADVAQVAAKTIRWGAKEAWD